MRFQAEAAQQMADQLARFGGSGLFDDMGLGKTVTMATVLAKVYSARLGPQVVSTMRSKPASSFGSARRFPDRPSSARDGHTPGPGSYNA